MPGLLQNTVHQGYDYLSPYVEKAQPYVERARSNVPLVDPALKTAEELVPALITRADQLAEPQIEKMRPFVEPRIEQAKEKVTPIVDEGVKQYGVLREESVKYYRVGLEKVEQVKGYKDAKELQIREFAEQKTTQIREFTDPKVEKIKEFTGAKTTQIREFTDPKVEKVKEFTEAKTTQIKEFAEPKVEKIKEFMEPKVAGITARQRKMQKLLRVPGSLDLQGLKYETLLGKVASWLEKMEALLDRYLPLAEEQISPRDSDSSNLSDSSCVRINRSVVSIVTRPLSIITVTIMTVSSLPMQLKTYCTDGTLERWIKTKVAAAKAGVAAKSKPMLPILTQVNEKLAPTVKALSQTSLFKKATQMAVLGSDKILGKARTSTILKRAEASIPAAWKAAPSPVAANGTKASQLATKNK